MKVLINLFLLVVLCFSNITVAKQNSNDNTKIAEMESIKDNTLISIHKNLHCVENLSKKYDKFFKLNDTDYRLNHKDLKLKIEDFENLKKDYNNLENNLSSLQSTIDLFIEYDYDKIKSTIIELKKNEKLTKFKKTYNGPSAKELQAKFKSVWPLKEWSIDNLNSSYKEKYNKSLIDELNDLYSQICLLKKHFDNAYRFVDTNTPDGARIIEEWDKAFNESSNTTSSHKWGDLEVSAVKSYGNGIDGKIAIIKYLKDKVSCYIEQK